MKISERNTEIKLSVEMAEMKGHVMLGEDTHTHTHTHTHILIFQGVPPTGILIQQVFSGVCKSMSQPVPQDILNLGNFRPFLEELWLFCKVTFTHLSSFSPSQTIQIQTKCSNTPSWHLHAFACVVLLAWNSSPIFSLCLKLPSSCKLSSSISFF